MMAQGRFRNCNIHSWTTFDDLAERRAKITVQPNAASAFSTWLEAFAKRKWTLKSFCPGKGCGVEWLHGRVESPPQPRCLYCPELIWLIFFFFYGAQLNTVDIKSIKATGVNLHEKPWIFWERGNTLICSYAGKNEIRSRQKCASE